MDVATVCESILLWGWAQGGEAPVWPAVGFPWDPSFGSPSVREQLALVTLQTLLMDQPSPGLWSPPEHQSFTDHWAPNEFSSRLLWLIRNSPKPLSHSGPPCLCGFSGVAWHFHSDFVPLDPRLVWGYALLRREAVVTALRVLIGLMTLTSITCGLHPHPGALFKLSTARGGVLFSSTVVMSGYGVPWAWLQPMGWYYGFASSLWICVLTAGPDPNPDFLAWCWTHLIAVILPCNLDSWLDLAALSATVLLGCCGTGPWQRRHCPTSCVLSLDSGIPIP